jgi:hypothetical protein
MTRKLRSHKEERMSEQIVNFKITNLAAELDESTSFEWQGKTVDPGSFTVELNEK